MSFDFLGFVAHGLMPLPWWGYVVVALVLTHVTIASVTIFLHRARRTARSTCIPSPAISSASGCGSRPAWSPRNGSRSIASTTRKVETPDDPHSPQTRGIKTVFWRGTELYRAESKNAGDAGEVRPRHARRLDRAQRLHALLVARRRPDAGGQPHAVRRDRRHDLGRADGVDPGHRRRHHQRHRPLLGLSQFRVAPTRRPTSCRGAS